MREIAVGFDIGTRKIAAACPEAGWYESIDMGRKSKRRTRVEELMEQARWVRDVMSALEMTLCATGKEGHLRAFIEQPFLSGGASRNPTVTMGLTSTATVITVAWRWRKDPVLVPPTAWKKLVVNEGHASKDAVAAHVTDELGPNIAMLMNQDEMDAWCIGTFGERVLDGRITAAELSTKIAEAL